jgi:RsiW-degrading membrane proteinase PrsW (M82 family)
MTSLRPPAEPNPYAPQGPYPAGQPYQNPAYHPPYQQPPPGPVWQQPASGPAVEPPADTRAADRTLAIRGGACVAVSLLSVSLRLAHVLPSGIATAIVVLVVAVGLRILMRYAAKSASSAHRARVVKTVALVGLGISVLTICTSLPVLLRGGGSNDFVANMFAHLWTIAILLVVVGGARTLNWQTFLGMGLTGFLAVSGLAFAILRPVVKSLGSQSVFASVIFAPLVEEVLKALPALLTLIIAARRQQARPSALEMALLGAVIGSGYALYEDIQYHRGGFHFAAMPIIGIVNPTAFPDSSIRVTYFGAGHMVYTMLIVFGLAIGLLYRKHYSWAKYAIPVCFTVSFVEHATQNYATIVAAHQGNAGIFDLLRVLTLCGWLSTVLLIAGIVLVGREERRATSQGVALKDSVLASFWLKPVAAGRAATALARLQLGAEAPVRRGVPR